MHLFRVAKRAWPALAVAAVCASYFYGLGAVPLLGPDEPRYAQVAREMWTRGDPVTPTLAGHTWFEKPALLYWLMMAAYTAFGVTEFAARAGSAVAGLLTALLVGWAARRVEREAGGGLRGFGVTGAAVTATSVGLVVFSRGASFDILLTLTMTAALACFLVSELEAGSAPGESGGRQRRWLLAGAYAGVGASLLAKGLIGALLPAGVVAAYFLLRRALPRPFTLGVLWGPPLALAVAAVWYAPVTARHGWAFVDEFFVQHHFARYLSNKYNHPEPFHFFLRVVPLLALPWTAFLLSALARARGWDWRGGDATSRLRVLALAWLAVPVVFFSFSGSKLPGYVLPALPGALLLAAERVTRYARGEGETLTMRLTGALLLVWVAGGAAYAASAKVLPAACVLVVVAPAFVAGATALLSPRRRVLCVAAVAGASLLTVVLGVGCALAPLARRESVRDLLRRADAEAGAPLPVLLLHDIERTAEFYAAGRLVYDEEGQPLKYEGVGEITEATKQRGGRSLVFVPHEYVTQLTNAAWLDTRVVGDDGRFACVLVRVK